MIREINMLTEVKPGQWIVMEPVLRDHICTEPREVVRRAGKRVYFRNRLGVDEGKYCDVKSVVALCDTKAEADKLFVVSQKQFDELRNVRARRREQFEALFA